MKTKIFTIFVFLLTFSLMLTSCSLFHKHSFMEWETTKNATCSEAGVRERICKCGEKQTENISPVGHAVENGICVKCETIFSPYVALRHAVKTNGTLEENNYMLTKNFTDTDTKSWISVGVEDEKIAFGYASGELLLAIFIDPTQTKQDIMMMYVAGGSTYYSQGYINNSVDLHNLVIHDFSTSTPAAAAASMQQLMETSTGNALRNISTMLKQIKPNIPMKVLGFSNIT